MIEVLSVENMRESDKATIVAGTSSRELMWRAALGIYEAMGEVLTKAHTPLIVAGTGNTAGDGYALALILKETRLGGEIISLVDQGIKMISIFLSAYLAAKNSAEDMIPSGIAAGTLYIVLGYFSFSLIEGCFGDIKKLFLDLLMGAAIGLITALICGKTKKKKGLKRA